MTSNKFCYPTEDQHRVMLRVDGEWVFYTGSTSMRKLYYRAYEMVKYNNNKFWVYEYGDKKVDAAIFPDRFWRYLSCCSINGIPCDELPTRLFAKPKLQMTFEDWFKANEDDIPVWFSNPFDEDGLRMAYEAGRKQGITEGMKLKDKDYEC